MHVRSPDWPELSLSSTAATRHPFGAANRGSRANALQWDWEVAASVLVRTLTSSSICVNSSEHLKSYVIKSRERREWQFRQSSRAASQCGARRAVGRGRATGRVERSRRAAAGGWRQRADLPAMPPWLSHREQQLLELHCPSTASTRHRWARGCHLHLWLLAAARCKAFFGATRWSGVSRSHRRTVHRGLGGGRPPPPSFFF